MKKILNISNSTVVLGGTIVILPHQSYEIEDMWITPQIAVSIKANLDMHLIRIINVPQPIVIQTENIVVKPVEEEQEHKDIVVKEEIKEKPKTETKTSAKKCSTTTKKTTASTTKKTTTTKKGTK